MDEKREKFDFFDELLSIISLLSKTKSVFSTRVDLSEKVSELYKNLEDALRLCQNVRYALVTKPINGLLLGQSLTKEEFCFLLARGVISMGALDDAYIEFCHHRYEDDKCAGYIMPGARPGNYLKCEIVPEDVKVNYLSVEQIEYFKNNCPDLFKRFKKK